MLDAITNKEKTGWTVPVGYWLTNAMDDKLKNFYNSRVGKEALRNTTASQKSAKMLIPYMMVKDWKTTYRMENA